MKTTQQSDNVPHSRASADPGNEQKSSAVSLPAPVAQMATSIKYGNLQPFVFGEKKGYVGSKMEAYLDPNDKRTGTDTAGSNAYSSLFNELQANTDSSWVRGHLLNHDLGGIAHYNNLFPITTAANSEHKFEVEYPVKHWLNKGCEIAYKLDAEPHDPHNKDCANATFKCEAEVKKGHDDLKGKKVSKSVHSLMKKTKWTRKLKDDKTQDAESFAKVDHNKGNDIFRDTYGSAKARKGWEHDKGDKDNNYFYDNGNKIVPNEDTMKFMGLLEEDYYNFMADFVEDWVFVGAKELDKDELKQIKDDVYSQSNDRDERIKLAKQALEDAGYTFKKKDVEMKD